MVKNKYGIDDEMYLKMSYHERNEKLKEMLSNDTVLIFPNDGLTQVDGMPNFGILLTDLKDSMNTKQVAK